MIALTAEQHDQHCLLTVARENGYTFRIVHIGPGGLTLSDHGGMCHVRWRNELARSFRTGGTAESPKLPVRRRNTLRYGAKGYPL
jgi:hypothetical protein